LVLHASKPSNQTTDFLCCSEPPASHAFNLLTSTPGRIDTQQKKTDREWFAIRPMDSRGCLTACVRGSFLDSRCWLKLCVPLLPIQASFLHRLEEQPDNFQYS
jgi:hypothetical protein